MKEKIDLAQTTVLEIPVDNLDNLERKMLENYHISHIIPITFVQENDRIKMNVSNERRLTLREYIKREKYVTDELFYCVLETLMRVQKKATDYFLLPNKFMVSLDTILVGRTIREISFLYMPLQNEEFPTVEETLKELSLTLFAMMDEEQEVSSDILYLSDIIRSPHFSYSFFYDSIYKVSRDILHDKKHQTQVTSDKEEEVEKKSFLMFFKKSNSKEKKEVGKKPANTSKKQKINLLAIILLLELALYQIFSLNYEFIVGTIVLALLAFIGIKQFDKKKPEEIKETNQETAEQIGGFQELVSSFKNESTNSIKHELLGYDTPPATVKDETIIKSEGHENISERVVQDTPQIAKKISSLMTSSTNNEGSIYVKMLKQKNGQTVKTIDINKQHYLIGRNENRVDFIDEEKAVSKVHFELFCMDDSIFIRDLNSKYGTFLNGIRLQPYQLYKVVKNDAIDLKHSRYLIDSLG